MRNLWHYLIIEWKLLFRGPMFWIVCALSGGMFLLFSSEYDYHSNIGKFAMQQSLFLVIIFLMGPLIAIHIARRDFMTKNDLLLDALPTRYWQLQTAKIAGLAIPLSIITLLPAAIFTVHVFQNGIPLYIAAKGIAVLVSAIIPVCFSVIIGFIIATLSRKRWIYVVGIVGFLASAYLFQLFVFKAFPHIWMRLFDFAQMDTFRSELYSVQWGFTHDITFWLHRLIYASSVIVAYLAYLLIGMRRRKENQGRRKIYGLAALMLTISIVSITLYMQISLDRMAFINAEKSFYYATYEESTYDNQGKRLVSEKDQLELDNAEEYAGLIADRYTLSLYPENGHHLKVEALVELSNGTKQSLKRFPMTLKHYFNVESVRVNGETARYEWELNRDYIWVTPATVLSAGERASIEIIYRGKVDEWRYEPNYDVGVYWRQAFVDDEQLYLPGRAGWFPFPGMQQLTRYDKIYFASSNGGRKGYSHLIDENFALPPAEYNVNIISDKPLKMLPVVGSMNQTSSRDGLYRTELYAEKSPGFTILSGPMKLITSRSGGYEFTIAMDQYATVDNEQNSKASLVRLTDRTLQLFKELWPENTAHHQSLTHSVTMMKKEYFQSDLNLNFRDLVTNADGIATLPFDFNLPRYDEGDQNWWVTMLFESHVDDTNYARFRFYELLSSYLGQSLTEKNGQPLMIDRYNGPNNSDFEHLNRIYEQSSEQEFKQFIKDYYNFISKIESDDVDLIRQEEEFLKARAGESR
ncbi:hypothetical protein [Cohnella sp. WQ 127256]|uniref:hypothetical protein n=1 Tax=Cohnella sp. WQ 127256 TaxID=2938790 RepID=UPI002117EA18|nr:hypothetical protein [Cohnella sp. WQ 127256]